MKAPYNFVPLNKEVFFPDWADKVSHEYPFKDSQSGVIEVEIEAKSPIFIKHGKEYNENEVMEFCHFIDENGNKKYYIPGSSLKGMVRTILEIISFSKIKIQDRKLSYRDLHNPSYKRKAMNANKIYMGWLYQKNGEIFIEEIGKVTNGQTRIKYKEMENFLGKNIVNKIRRAKKAYEKYKIVNFDFNKLKIPQGTIVFTGSTGNKTREFLFPNTISNVYEIDNKLFETFKEAYKIGTLDESEDWEKVWKNRFKQGKKIPVFFQKEGDKIKHFGLSMLYKLPYENSIKELVENYQKQEDKLDLAETIFGTTELKGRVFFSHLEAVEVKEYRNVTLILSSPKPTFYPSYLVQCEQNGKLKPGKDYITYDNKKAIIRGFKVYPPKNGFKTFSKICNQNPKVCSKLAPLNAGTKFRGKIVFHNLKEEELGALISALTFFNKEGYYHKLGTAKPYGYGTVKIKIDFKEKEKYIKKFVSLINQNLSINLLNSPRIQKLLEFSKIKDAKEFDYMELKDFMQAKRNKEVLKGADKQQIETSCTFAPNIQHRRNNRRRR